MLSMLRNSKSLALAALVFSGAAFAQGVPTGSGSGSGGITPGTTGAVCATAGSILYSDGTLVQCAGAVKATSLALGGATIGAYNLAVTGDILNTGNLVSTNAIRADSGFNSQADMFFGRAAAATFRHGAADVASGAVAQTITAQGNTGAATTGPAFSIKGAGGGSGASVGGTLDLYGGVTSAAAGTGGAIRFYTAPAAAGNTPTLALTISSTAQLLAADGTQAAPQYSFANSTGTGFWQSGGIVFLSNSGLRTFVASSALLRLRSGGVFAFAPDGNNNSTEDTGVSRISAGVIGIGTGAAASIAGTLQAANYDLRPGTAIPAGGTAGFGFRATSTSNFGVFFGSGAPSLAAAKGSLYLRSDGSTTNDRMYVNTDGSTTWTAVTTAS